MQILLDGPSSSEESVRNSTADVAAVRATISAISTSGPSAESQGSPHSGEPFAVLSSTIDANGVAPSTRNYLRQLTRSANAAAASLACGSILAGHTSETDEYGDVAVWLGSDKYSPGHELDVLSLLGFETVAGPVKEVKLSSDTGLPTTVHSPAHPDPTVIQLRELLGRLQDIHIFFFQRSDPCVYLLLGRYDSEGQSGFAGLLGLGVQS